MPPRSPKMKRRIFGFQRRVWWPKWTPASRSSRIVTAIGLPSWWLGVRAPAGVWWNRRSDAGTATCPDRRVGDEKSLESVAAAQVSASAADDWVRGNPPVPTRPGGAGRRDRGLRLGARALRRRGRARRRPDPFVAAARPARPAR